jgi:homoserine O-acetyltransferase
MGGIQSFEWAAVFPDSTDRVISVVGTAEADGYLIENLDVWSTPIKVDPKWNNGDYYGREEPVSGLTAAYKLVIHQAQHYGGVSKMAGRKWAQEGKDPAKSWENNFAAEAGLNGIAAFFAKVNDANSFLYQAKAIQLFVAGDRPTLDAGLENVKARLLILPAELTHGVRNTPRMRPRAWAARKVSRVPRDPGDGGHIDGIFNIAREGDLIGDF